MNILTMEYKFSVGGMKGNAEAKKKKDAKGLAAQKLMQLLEPVGVIGLLVIVIVIFSKWIV